MKEAGQSARVVYAQDRRSGIKLFASQAWYVRDAERRLSAFLLKGDAEAHAKAQGGDVLDFAYHLKFKKEATRENLVRAVKGLPGAKAVNLLMQESIVEV